MSNHKIAVIGHGNVGGTLALRWKNSGYDVVLGARDPEAPSRNECTDAGIPSTSIEQAALKADVILVAIPSHATVDLAKKLPDLTGKIMIDATNAVVKKPSPYDTGFHAFEDLTEAAVVKAFNSTGFENMRNPVYGDIHLDMFMAGDDDNAKSVIKRLATNIGFEECYDFGGSDKVVLLEKFALSWINLAIMQGHGRDIGFKVVRRG
ncbi:MAG: NAD(P)-binding domain-containing protein [Bacteroidetes bacterium]|jgi:predicted dinucleotide-binding enzyme|nr:NAD(P)-binding domain-containing protein [Bacteroidota bacterium]